jgi:hypothetical protein
MGYLWACICLSEQLSYQSHILMSLIAVVYKLEQILELMPCNSDDPFFKACLDEFSKIPIRDQILMSKFMSSPLEKNHPI